MFAPPPPRTLRRDLLAALGNVADAFEPNELAYLALTSNPEFQIRDKLAWQLTKAGHRVAREYKRCDLAMLDGNEPAAIVELKAPHTGDVRWGRSGERAAIARKHGVDNQLEGVIREDVEKAKKLAPAAETYVLVVLTHVADPVSRELHALVKYVGQRRRVADKREGERTISGSLTRLGETSRVPLGSGTAFDLRCCVDAWLCGPAELPKPNSGNNHALLDK